MYQQNNLNFADEELEIATDIFEKWADALLTGSQWEVAEMYAKDAVLMPIMSNDIMVGRKEIANYFESFLKIQPKTKLNKIYLRKYSNNSISMFGKYILITKKEVIKVMYTFEFIRIDKEWLIEHHHSSM